MKCPSCNSENFDGAKFCTECGQVLSQAVTCPNCGANDINGNSRFCPHCGGSLSVEGNTIASNTTQSRTIIPNPPIRMRNLEFKCTVVASDGKRKGTLTVTPDKITFKTGWFIGFAAGSIDFTFPIQSIIAIEQSYTDITIVNDDNQYVCLGGNGYFSSDDRVLDDICSIIELYRRMFWMYTAKKYPDYPKLAEIKSSRYNDVSTEALIKRYNNM